MATARAAPDLLFAGRLLRVKDATGEIQIEKDAITFLQKLADPLTVVSVHGAKGSGKTTLVHDLVAKTSEGSEEVSTPAELPHPSDASGVWLYVKRAHYSSVKYIAIIDRPGFSGSAPLDTLLYSILAGLSSVVINHVDGELTTDAIEQFSFLAATNDEKAFVFPHGPKLMWLLQNVTSNDLKDRVGEKNVSIQEVEQTYLRSVFANQPPHLVQLYEQLRAAFPDQICCPIPRPDSAAYNKRVDKLSRVLMESGRNRYLKGVMLNGPLFGSILVSMLAHRDNIYQAFRGRVWKDIIHNCCLNIVESAIKLYKSRMSEQVAGIVDTSDLGDYTPLFAPKEPRPPVELPCESDVLHGIHLEAKRLAKLNLRTMPVRSGKLNQLLQKLFKDLVDSLYSKIKEENNRLSSDLCQALLTRLFDKLKAKMERHLEIKEGPDSDAYAAQRSEFKRFFHNYQLYLYDLMGEYTEQAKGPVKRQELSQFFQTTVRLQIASYSEQLQKIREQDEDTLEEAIKENERKIEDANENQRLFQKEAMGAQTEVNKQLVEVARLQSLRREALEGAIDDLTSMHEMATKQKQLLEEAAFVSVQLPSQKVIEAAQETEVMHLQGYLIKQGGGGNAFNPLGRRNWKQRYFILTGDSLCYAKTKDEYERGKIIKELRITGCRIEPSMDAGEGFNIIPPESGKSSHVYELQKGLFDKNSKKRSSQADNGRIFKLRAQSIEERDAWIEKLRHCAGTK
ncbi:hypothetical protein PINS_up001628 [Pythium insidiosum]|nr:hypothetical protein PINS_up001628 [Pythium insidiosum]